MTSTPGSAVTIFLQNLHAIQFWHREISNNDLWTPLKEQLQAGFRFIGRNDFQSFLLKGL
jgi:hypothetical protein